MGQGLLISPQEAYLHPQPRTFLKKRKKWGFPISHSSLVQPDVSYINDLFCLFILMGGLSFLPHQPGPSLVCPQPPSPGWGEISGSSLLFLLVVAPAGCIAF